MKANTAINRDISLAQEESNLVVRPGEIHMSEEEMRGALRRNGLHQRDPSCITENDDRDFQEGSNRTGMEEREQSRSHYITAIQVSMSLHRL